MSTKNFSSFENLVNLFTSISNKLKNKVDESLLKDTVGWINKNLLPNDRGKNKTNGLTCFWNSDGSLTINGTAGSQGSSYYVFVSRNAGFSLPDGDYILSGGLSEDCKMYISTSDGESRIVENSSGYTKFTATNNELDNVGIGLEIQPGQVFENTIIYPMLQKVGTSTSFEKYNKNNVEQYVHNNGSSIVNLIKDTVGWVGKNLLPYPIGTRQVIAADGTISDTAAIYLSDYIDISDFTSLCIKTDNVQGTVYMRFAFYNNEKVFLSRPTITFNSTHISDKVDVPDNAYYVRLCFEDVDPNIVSRPMLYDADAIDDNYVPYHDSVNKEIQAVYEEIQNIEKGSMILVKDTVGWSKKNLLNLQMNTMTRADVTCTHNMSDGTYILDGTSSGAIGFYLINGTFEGYINDVDNGTYILSGNPGTADAFLAIARVVKPGQTGTYKEYQDNGDGVIVDIDNDTYYYRPFIWIKSNNKTFSGTIFKPMLRSILIKDNTYEPYHNSIEQILQNFKVIKGKNLLPYPKGKRAFITDAGDVVLSSDMYLSDFIEIDGKAITFSAESITGTPSVRIGFYDYNKAFISRISYNVLPWTPSTIPMNAKYVRICFEDGEPHHFTNMMLMFADERDTTYEPYQDPLQDSKTDIALINKIGSKNILPYPFYNTTLNAGGVIFTDNGDQTITASGASEVDSQFSLYRGKLPTGHYILTVDNLSENFQLNIDKNNDGVWSGLAWSSTDTLEFYCDDTDYDFLNIAIRKKSPVTTSVYCPNMKPMLRFAEYKDSSYEPWGETNQELTRNKVSYDNYEITGVKNIWGGELLIPEGKQQGVTYTIDETGYTIHTGSTSQSGIFWNGANTLRPYFIKEGFSGMGAILSFEFKGDDEFSGQIGIASSPEYRRQVTTEWQSVRQIINDLSIIDSIAFYAYNETETHNLYIKNLMLRPSSDFNDNYTPFTFTNRQITNQLMMAETAVTDIIEGASVADNTAVHDMGNHLFKMGRLVTIQLHLIHVTATAWNDIIFKVPKGFRPNANMRFLGIGGYNWFVDTDGVCKMQQAVTDATVIFTASWVTP